MSLDIVNEDLNYHNIIVTIHRISYEAKNTEGGNITDVFYSNYDTAKPKIELVDYFATFNNNKVLGIQWEEASVYGSKAEISLTDPNRELAEKIDKYDVVNIYYVDPNQIDFVQMGEELINDYVPFLGSILADTDILGLPLSVKEHVKRNEARFSGIIVNISHNSSNSAQLHLEVQDFTRILQQLNIEDIGISSEPVVDPRFLDSYLFRFPEVDIEPTYMTHVSSKLLGNIAESFSIHARDKFTDDDFYKYEQVGNLDDMYSIDFVESRKIFVYSFSENMIMVRMTPMTILQYFLDYINKHIDYLLFFEVRLDYDDLIEKIMRDVEKISSRNASNIPLLTFFIRYANDGNIVEDNLSEDNFEEYFNRDIRYVFSEVAFDEMLLDDIPEQYILYKNILSRGDNTEEDTNTFQNFLKDIFINLMNLDDTITTYAEEVTTRIGEETVSQYFLKKSIKEDFLSIIDTVKNIFRTSISFDLIINNHRQYIRSTAYNPGIQGQDTQIPMTQFIQMLISSMFYIPVKYSESIGGDNIPYDIVQRIWLKSYIKTRESSSSDLSNYMKTDFGNHIPVIQFRVKMAKPLSENADLIETDAVGLHLNQIIDQKFMDIPKEGYVGVYRNFSSTSTSNSRMFDFIIQPEMSQIHTGNLYLGNLFTYDLNEIYKSYGVEQGRYNMINTDKLSEMRSSGGILGNRLNNNPIPRFASLHSTASIASIRDNFDDIFTYHDINGNRKNIHLGYNVKGFKSNTKYSIASGEKMSIFAMTLDNDDKKVSIDQDRDMSDLKSDLTDDIKKLDYFRDGGTPFIKTEKGWSLVVGLVEYIDLKSLYRPYKIIQTYMDEGYEIYNALGKIDFYKKSNIFTQLDLNLTNVDLTTFEVGLGGSSLMRDFILTEDDIDNDEIHEYTMKQVVDAIVQFLERLDDNNKARDNYMKMRYAKKIYTLPVSEKEGEKYRYITDNKLDMGKLNNSITLREVSNPTAENTLKVLTSFLHGFLHYMFKVSKINSIGGFIYLPLSSYIDKITQDIFEIGDAIYFKDELKVGTDFDNQIPFQKFFDIVGDTGNRVADFLKGERQVLSLKNKIFYIWKIIHYFGGSDTSSGGTSGSTQRIYLTDSTIHWHHSYEEGDIMTRVAESFRTKGIPNPLRGF